MKKLFLINLGVVAMVLSTVLLPSCKKKIVHETHPTPGNNRIMSYSKYTTPLAGDPFNENYRFYYNGDGRVTEIAYTANMVTGVNQQRMLFTYIFNPVEDTIVKTTIKINIDSVMERDTFIVKHSTQLLTRAYFPGYQIDFEYFGKLISRQNVTYYNRHVRVTQSSTYTSNNGDLINHAYDGNLTANFYNDSLVPPLQVTWYWGSPTKTVNTVIPAPSRTTSLNEYSGYGFYIAAVDDNDSLSEPLSVQNLLFTREEYRVYPDLDNRPGDLFQVESFTTYGMNIYNNAHLLRNVYGTGNILGQINVDYDIDADSKITQTFVTGYGYTSTSSIVYKFQYETF